MVLNKKKKPKFNVPNYGVMKSVKKRWRKPRGTHNKKRMKFKWAGALPKIGYRNEVGIRGLHPSGRTEILLYNSLQLDAFKGKEADVAIRIASSVGGKKRKMLLEKATAMKLFVLNSGIAKVRLSAAPKAPHAAKIIKEPKIK